MSTKEGTPGVRFDEAAAQPESEAQATAVRVAAAEQQRRRLLQRPHTAAVTAAAVSNSATSSGAPFLDARGNRTQPSREQPSSAAASSTTKKKRRRKRGRPKTAIGIEQQPGGHHPHPQSANPSVAASGSEPNFPALNPRVFQALRGFLTPDSLRKTKFYSDREEKMVARSRILDDQQKRLGERIGVFYQRLDTFIAETNAAKNWEPEDKRKQKNLLDNLDNL